MLGNLGIVRGIWGASGLLSARILTQEDSLSTADEIRGTQDHVGDDGRGGADVGIAVASAAAVGLFFLLSILLHLPLLVLPLMQLFFAAAATVVCAVDVAAVIAAAAAVAMCTQAALMAAAVVAS